MDAAVRRLDGAARCAATSQDFAHQPMVNNKKSAARTEARAPPVGRRAGLRLDAQTERFAAEAEGNGLAVFWGVTVMLRERTARIVVSRSSTFGEFTQQAALSIRTTAVRNHIELPEQALEDLQFFVGSDNMCPLPDVSMMEIERKFKGADEVVLMLFLATH